MMGAVVKSFYADRLSMNPRDLYVVSVMPCTAKKYEIERGEMEVDGNRDVDAVLTTRERGADDQVGGHRFRQSAGRKL